MDLKSRSNHCLIRLIKNAARSELVQDSSSVLLDESVDRETQAAILSAIEQDSDNRVVDLHVWLLSSHHLAATISLVTHDPKAPEYYKALLSSIKSLAHVVVEVNPCQGQPCVDLLPANIEHSLRV